MKACIISAPMSGSGKTTVALGLMSALRRRGMQVQPFKVGPDFIDPGLHEIATGNPSHNLDGWMLPREMNEWVFSRAAMGKDVSVVEGVMGLFDGHNGKTEAGSTAEMAAWLDLPVIIVIDAHAMARTAAAIVQGLRSFDARLKVAGVILNRVGGAGHYGMLKDAIEDTPILGWLPAEPSVEIPERHLGLFTAKDELAAARVAAIGEFFERHVEISTILDALPPMQMINRRDLDPHPARFARLPLPEGEGCRVAIARDKAFSFYYHANRFQLEQAGAEIIDFSPLADREVPDADFLYIGGGYPELYRHELENNASMRDSIRRFIERDHKFYAECGGLMYLARSLEGSKMVGVLPVDIQMTAKPVDFGYCEIETLRDSILGPIGTRAKGHQFHYSRCAASENHEEAYIVRQGPREYSEGFAFPNGIASYIHLHFLSNSALARNMLHS
jgi:cobyrinic acid a,c-diamide synthase